MKKVYQKYQGLEPTSTPRLTEAVGIRLVWRAENKLKVQSAKLKVAVKVKNYEK